MRAVATLVALALAAAGAVAAGGAVYLLDSRLDAETINATVLLCAATPALLGMVVAAVGAIAWFEQRRWQRQQAEAERRQQRIEAQRQAEAEALRQRQQQRAEHSAEIHVTRELVELLAATARAQTLAAHAQRAQLQPPALEPLGWNVPAEWAEIDAE